MAKPIRATPKLTAIESEKFIKKMIQVNNSKPTAQDKIIAKEVMKFLPLH